MKLLFIVIMFLAKPVASQNERFWIDKHCLNNQAYTATVPVDCLTDEHAIEFDFSSKWAESIGQSLYYAQQTNKAAAVFIICKDSRCKRHLHKLKTTINFYKLPIKILTNESQPK